MSADSLQSLVAGLRNSEPVLERMINAASKHPIMVASNNFIAAENALVVARERLNVATKELGEAQAELAARSDAFNEQKSQLAELLK